MPPFQPARLTPAPGGPRAEAKGCQWQWLVINSIHHLADLASFCLREACLGLAEGRAGWNADSAGKVVGDVGGQGSSVILWPYCGRATRAKGQWEEEPRLGQQPAPISAPSSSYLYHGHPDCHALGYGVRDSVEARTQV